MSTTTNIQSVVDVALIDKDGKESTIDVSSINSLYFIEDVFSFCMTGKLSFVDGGGLMETSNIWGWDKERIVITYGIPDSSNIQKEYSIYKLEKMLPYQGSIAQRENIVNLLLVSPSFYKWHFNQWSVSFKDKKITDILKHLMQHMIGESFEVVETSNESIPYFYTGLKSPAENFKYLMERSTGIETGKAGYVCFENSKGWNLHSLAKIMGDSYPVMEPKDGDNDVYRFSTENPWFLNKILSFEREGIDNSARQQIAGGYRIGYDILRKKNFKQEFNYQKSRQNHISGKEYPLFDPDITTGQEKFLKTGEDNEAFVDNIYENNWIKQYSNQQLVSFYVIGHELRHAGGMIDVRWPSTTAEKMNKNFNGKYFVKSITHYFFRDSNPLYNQKLVTVKNEYDDACTNEV